MSDAKQVTVFTIEKLYVKDISLEVPHTPQIFTQRDVPAVNLDLKSAARAVEGDFFEVVLTVTVTAKVAEKTAFLIEASQAGLFQLKNLPPEERDVALGVHCPTILLPYLREVVSDLAVRGGFPPVILNPINFAALYQQRLAQQAAPGSTLVQ